LRRLRKLKLSTLGWTKQTYENKNELLQPKQQSRKTAVSAAAKKTQTVRKIEHTITTKFFKLIKLDREFPPKAWLPLTSCGFATVAEIGTEFARLDWTKLGNYNLIL